MKLKIKQIKNFIIGGGSATVLHYISMTILILLGTLPLLATTIGALFGAILNYIVQYHYTFKSKESHYRAIFSYSISVSFGFIANILLFALFYDKLHWGIIIAQLSTTAIIMVLNFIIYKYLVFKPKESH